MIQNLNFTCCFCNEGIEQNNGDPCDLDIMTNYGKQPDKRRNQVFWCHLKCFESQLHEKIQPHFLLGILSKDDE